MTDIKITTRELTKEYKPYGLEQNKKIAKMGGHTAKVARDDLEKNLNIKVITTDFHTLRSKIISKRVGYANTTFYTSSSNGALFILNYTREFFALICNIIFNC